MDYIRLRHIEPPLFDTTTSDVYNFFRRFRYFRESRRQPWDNDLTVIILKNLLDDISLDFVDSLPVHTQQNFNLLRDSLLDHYDKCPPLSVQWSELNQRVQRENESVIEYYGDILKLARHIQLTPEQRLYVFLNGLEKNTKLHLQINNPPANLADAFTRAKIYQSVNKTDKFSCSSTEINDSRQETFIDTLEKLAQIVQQLTEITVRCNRHQNVAPTSLYPVENQMPNFPFHESTSSCSSFSDNGNEFLENQTNLSLIKPVSNDTFENRRSTQKFSGRENDCDNVSNNNKNTENCSDNNGYDNDYPLHCNIINAINASGTPFVTTGKCTVNYNSPDKKDTLFNIIDDATKGLLNQDTIIPSHTEIDVFLRSENILDLECKKVQLKGLGCLTMENVMVYSSAEVLVTSEGIPCKLSNFSANSVKLDNDTQIAWLTPLPSTLACSEFKDNLPSHNDESSNVKYQNDILTDIRHLFVKPTEKLNVIVTDILEKQVLAEKMEDTEINVFANDRSSIEPFSSEIKTSSVLPDIVTSDDEIKLLTNTEDTSEKINVCSKSYLCSRDSLFLKYYISFILTFCMVLLLLISPFGFLKQKPLKNAVDTKLHVDFTKIYLPEGKICPKHHFANVTHNSVTFQRYFTSIPIVSLLLYFTKNTLVRIEHLFFSAGRGFQQFIPYRLSLKINLNAIRHGNAPFGRLKMF